MTRGGSLCIDIVQTEFTYISSVSPKYPQHPKHYVCTMETIMAVAMDVMAMAPAMGLPFAGLAVTMAVLWIWLPPSLWFWCEYASHYGSVFGYYYWRCHWRLSPSTLGHGDSPIRNSTCAKPCWKLVFWCPLDLIQPFLYYTELMKSRSAWKLSWVFLYSLSLECCCPRFRLSIFMQEPFLYFTNKTVPSGMIRLVSFSLKIKYLSSWLFFSSLN